MNHPTPWKGDLTRPAPSRAPAASRSRACGTRCSGAPRPLDNPRVHAILAQTLNAAGDPQGAVDHIDRHLDLVTTELVPTAPIAPGDTFTLPLVPGRTYAIPVFATAGQMISIATSSPDADLWDTIMALDGPNGAPVVGADDTNDYWAALDWVAPATGTYVLHVTSFEAVTTGELVVTRD